jgi:putative membrane protein
MMGISDGWSWVGMFFMLLFWFGLAALIVWAIVGPRTEQTPSTIEGPGGDRAQAILRERYARGEIAEQEFEQRRDALRDSGR